VNMDVRVDIADAKMGLEAIGIESAKAVRPLLSAIANAGKKWIRGRFYLAIHRMTGKLARDVKTTLKGNYATIAGNPARINETLESGGTLRPTKRKYLTFRLADGSSRRMHSVTIPARHHFTRAAQGFDDSAEYVGAIDKAVARIIRKAGME
jgi:hypothetical protein